MSSLFLLGGGANEAAYLRTYWQFIEAATRDNNQRIAIVIVEETKMNKERKVQFYRAPFEFFQMNDELHVMFVSSEEPLTAARLAEIDATGVFVVGGAPAAYHDVLCRDQGWLEYVLSRGLPYAGFSAGAMILPGHAIMGGFRLGLLHSNTVIVGKEWCEDIDFLEVRDGLGLVPFAVEAHATQTGCLSRLMHAVGEGLVPSGWAIDEGCMLRIDGDELRVCGVNNAYRIHRLGDMSVKVDTFRHGAMCRRADW